MSEPSWSYSSDPTSSPRDTLRFVLQDTDETFQLLKDAELDYLLEVWMPRYDSITYVAAIAAATIARKFTGIVNVSADGVSVDTSSLSKRFTDQAVALRDEYKAAQIGGEINIDNVLIGHGHDDSIRPLRFSVGLHDNPGVGLQDYGGLTYDPFTDANSMVGGWGEQ